MKNLSVSNNIQVTLFFFIMGAISLTCGIFLQHISFKLAILFSILIIIGVIGLLFKISIRNFCIFYGLLLLYPIVHVIIPFSFFIIVIILIYMAQNREVSFKIPHPIVLLVLLLSGTQAYLKSMQYERSLLYYCTTILIPIVILISIYNSDLKLKSIKQIMYINIIISAFIGFLGIFIALSNPSERIGSTWVTAMTINGYYLINFFNGIGFLLTEKNQKKKLITLVLVFAILLGMLFTYTRMALLAVFFGFILIILRFKQYRKFFIVTLLIIPFIIPSSMTDRVGQGIQGDLSTVVRLLCWYNSIKLIASNFFFGIGFRAFATISRTMIPVDFLYAPHSHNIYLHLLLETGFFGFLAYFYIIFINIFRFFRKFVIQGKDEFMYMFFVSMLSIMFAGLTDIFIAQLTLSTFFWINFSFMLKLTNLPDMKLKSE